MSESGPSVNERRAMIAAADHDPEGAADRILRLEAEVERLCKALQRICALEQHRSNLNDALRIAREALRAR